MATYTFVLKDIRSTQPTPIYMIVREAKKRAKIGIGEKVLPEKWDNQSYKAKKGAADSFFINERIDEFISLFREFDQKQRNSRVPFDTEDFKKFVSLRMVKNQETDWALGALLKKDHDNTFGSKYLIFAKTYLYNNASKPSTKKAYGTAIKMFEAYEAFVKREIVFNDIDRDFYFSFLKFLEEKGLRKNTIGMHIKTLKAVLSEAEKREISIKRIYKSFEVPKEESDNIALNEEELQKIVALDLTNITRLERARDAFVVACRTGLRISDLKRITKDNIHNYDGKRMLAVRTSKTDNRVEVPLSKEVEDVLVKYNGEMPRIPSEQKYRMYIKEFSKLAGLDKIVGKSATIGGEKVTTTMKQYEMISSHTARRTFCTIMYQKGAPVHSLMRISGHRSESSFLKYIKLSEKEHALIISKYLE